MTDSEIELRIHSLETNMRSIMRAHHELAEQVDTIASPWWKKLWWLIQGYRWYKVGRWYDKTEDLQ